MKAIEEIFKETEELKKTAKEDSKSALGIIVNHCDILLKSNENLSEFSSGVLAVQSRIKELLRSIS